jgi:hypothetical protein
MSQSDGDFFQLSVPRFLFKKKEVLADFATGFWDLINSYILVLRKDSLPLNFFSIFSIAISLPLNPPFSFISSLHWILSH